MLAVQRVGVKFLRELLLFTDRDARDRRDTGTTKPVSHLKNLCRLNRCVAYSDIEMKLGEPAPSQGSNHRVSRSTFWCSIQSRQGLSNSKHEEIAEVDSCSALSLRQYVRVQSLRC